MEPFQQLLVAIRKPLRVLWTIFFILCILAFTYLVYWSEAVVETTAQRERDWLPEQALAADASINSDETITIYNVRDWSYSDKRVVAESWGDVTVNPKKIVRMWFVLEPFSDWKAVGHTLLTFEFDDGTALSFSVEARREAHEEYSALAGLNTTYELAYQWGTERDFVTRRLLFLDHPLRRYPLQVTPEQAEAIFISLIHQTVLLDEQPRWYNTLLDNCTNVLAQEMNIISEGVIPFDISWVLTGYSDRFLMDEGWITQIENSKTKTQDNYDLTKHKQKILDAAIADHQEFTALLNSFAE